jgi:DNA-directed RNA polymerase specialized sigma24 family protein
MAYVPGTTLEQILTERGKLPWAHVVRFGIEISLALCDTHLSGMIHGNLRPSNLLVSEQGRIKLTDLSVTEAPDVPPPAGVGRMSATTAYLAPEQIRGTPATGPKTDLYALGGVLYRMLTGDVPYQGTASNVPLQHYVKEPPPPPRTKVANIPAALDDLIIKLMANDPADRPMDAATVGMALIELWEKIGRGEPIPLANPQSTKDFDVEFQCPDDEVDLLCDQFRSTWRSGQDPMIEVYLADFPQPAHPRLLRRLLTLELELRRSHGEQPTPGEYQKRFPGYVAILNYVFEEIGPTDSLTLSIQQLRSPDSRERGEAALFIWEQFAPRLQALLRRHLDVRFRSRENEQNILQYVFSSFCVGQFEGQAAPSSREELWKLLVRITLRTVVDTTHGHSAARRDVRRERSETDNPQSSASEFPRWMLENVDRALPSDEEKDVAIEEIERLLHGLPDDLRSIVLWKLEGFTNAEIAAKIGRTVRSVELKMQLIRTRLESRSPEQAAAAESITAFGERPSVSSQLELVEIRKEQHQERESRALSGDIPSISVGSETQEVRKEPIEESEPRTKSVESPRPSPQEPSPFIRRHTDVSFPARVRQGKMNHLRVQIVPAQVVLPSGETLEVPKPHPHDATMTLKMPRPKASKVPSIKLEINVAAENFDIEGSPRAQIIVPLEEKSRPVNFRLRGEEIGPGRIMLDFSQAGRPLGSVDLYPEVIAADCREEPRRAPAEAAIDLSLGPGVAAPDLVIKVFVHRFAGQAGRLQYVVSSTLGGLGDLPVMDGDFGTIELKTEVAAWVEQRLLSVGSLAHRTDLTADEVSRTLAGVGHNLFEQLLPKTLQDLFWTIRGRNVRTILVLSDDPHIPWELIKPNRNNPLTGEFEVGEFWGQSYAMTHWLRGRPPVQRLSFNRICALAAGSGASPGGETTITRDMVPLATTSATSAELSRQVCPAPIHPISIDEELDVLRSLQTTGSRFRLLPARRGEILCALEQGEFDLLHLIAHGEFAGMIAADDSSVQVEDGALRVAELTPSMASALRRAAPLIFFNSCHSGRIGFSLTRLGSWGAQFVHLGCGGFVGTLWPVTDRAAAGFAQAFYEWMRQGLPIGEAMRRARQRVRERYPNDPTWLAYCCFADPMARLALHVEVQSAPLTQLAEMPPACPTPPL